MPAAVAAIRTGTASPIVKLAVEFVVLTGCRSGEARNATWDEIEKDTWTIPGERTKTAKPHRIPLSSRALELLNEARELGAGARLIFAAPPHRQAAQRQHPRQGTSNGRHPRNHPRNASQPPRLASSRGRALRAS